MLVVFSSSLFIFLVYIISIFISPPVNIWSWCKMMINYGNIKMDEIPPTSGDIIIGVTGDRNISLNNFQINELLSFLLSNSYGNCKLGVDFVTTTTTRTQPKSIRRWLSTGHELTWRKTTIEGRRHLWEDNVCWKMNFDGRRPLMEDNLWWKSPFNARRHLERKTRASELDWIGTT